MHNITQLDWLIPASVFTFSCPFCISEGPLDSPKISINASKSPLQIDRKVTSLSKCNGKLLLSIWGPLWRHPPDFWIWVAPAPIPPNAPDQTLSSFFRALCFACVRSIPGPSIPMAPAHVRSRPPSILAAFGSRVADSLSELSVSYFHCQGSLFFWGRFEGEIPGEIRRSQIPCHIWPGENSKSKPSQIHACLNFETFAHLSSLGFLIILLVWHCCFHCAVQHTYFGQGFKPHFALFGGCCAHMSSKTHQIQPNLRKAKLWSQVCQEYSELRWVFQTNQGQGYSQKELPHFLHHFLTCISCKPAYKKCNWCLKPCIAMSSSIWQFLHKRPTSLSRIMNFVQHWRLYIIFITLHRLVHRLYCLFETPDSRFQESNSQRKETRCQASSQSLELQIWTI